MRKCSHLFSLLRLQSFQSRKLFQYSELSCFASFIRFTRPNVLVDCRPIAVLIFKVEEKTSRYIFFLFSSMLSCRVLPGSYGTKTEFNMRLLHNA